MANYFKAKPKKSLPSTTVNLTIERLDNYGRGVAYLYKKPVFVVGALPTEQVKVQITEQKSKYSKAKLLKVIKESDDRQTPKCQHFNYCGGCNLQHLSTSAQIAFKQQTLTELLNRQGINECLPWQAPLIGDAWNYRRKARIGVQYDKNGQAIIGFRRQASNQLQPISHCSVLVTPLNDIFVQLKNVFAQLSQSKSVGHIEVMVSEQLNYNAQKMSVVTLVVRQLKPLNKQDTQLWLQFAKQHCWQVLIDDGEHLKALEELLDEPKALQYYLTENITISFKTNDFIQINQNINNKMVNQAIHWLDLNAEDQVLDLFCGLGNFTLPIAKIVAKVIGIEGVEDMVVRAKQNARANSIDNADFFQADLNSLWLESSWAKNTHTKAILDPARAGALVAVEQLVKLNIATILYVSCDTATLAVDSKILLNAGYKIIKIALMDMFTHTKHSETMVLFARES